MANSDSSSKPVPQPRRIINATHENTKTSYENVSIDLINKNIDINDDNLQFNRKSKIQNNKAFMLTASLTSDVHNKNTTDETSGASNRTVRTNQEDHRNVITEVNNLNLDKNKNASSKHFENSHKMNNVPVPAPRRKQNAELDEIYENNEEVHQDGPVCKQTTIVNTHSSGAISKNTNTTRKAPQIPLPPPPTIPPPIPEKKKMNNMTKSGVIVGDESEFEISPPPKTRLNKSLSNTSINSSNSSQSTHDPSFSPKYITISPG